MRRILTIVAILAAVTLFVPGSSYAVSTESEQVVELTIPTYGSELYSISLLPPGAESGSGTVIDPYIIKSSDVEVGVSLTGTGIITVKDDIGNVLATYTKLSNGPEDIMIPISLVNGIGTYQITATFTALDNPGEVFGAASIFVNWQALPFGIEIPNTGYFYIGSRAIAVSAVAFDLAILFVLTIITILAYRHYQHHRKNH